MQRAKELRRAVQQVEELQWIAQGGNCTSQATRSDVNVPPEHHREGRRAAGLRV